MRYFVNFAAAICFSIGTASAMPVSHLAGSVGLSSLNTASFFLVDTTGLIRNRGVSFYLADIKLPRFATCRDRAGELWGCGTASFVHWSRLFSSGKIHCHEMSSRNAAQCEIDREDAAIFLVKSGWAVVENNENAPLLEAERDAKKEHRGVWSQDKVF